MAKNSMIAAAAVGLILVGGAGGGLVYWAMHRAPDTVVIGTSPTPFVPPPAAATPAPMAPKLGAAASPAAIARSPLPTAMTADEQAAIASQISAGKPEDQKQAIATIRALETSDPRSLANGLTVWLEPLMAAQQFAVIDEVTLPAIMDRGFDNKMVPAAQRARVLALYAEQKFPEALSEAKGYYNIAPLSGTSDAVSLIAQILAKTDPSAVSQFQSEQAASMTANAAVPSTSNVLKNIKMDSTRYDTAIQGLVDHVGKNGEYSYSNWEARGNLFLLEDRAAEARQCFESGCKVAGTRTKDIREGLEGVAKSIRDAAGQAGPADAFILTVEAHADTAATALIGPAGTPTAADFAKAANGTALAGQPVVK